jgi:hypothetical protein
MTVFHRLILSAFFAFCWIGPAFAEQPREIGTFGDWKAYVIEEQNNYVCYMVSEPVKKEPAGARRGDIAAMITHRPGESVNNVFSYMAGYAYKKDGRVQVKIDGKSFKLFTQNDMAWAADGAADLALSQALRNGSKMVVTGESSRGTKTTDTYSLKGSTKAHEAISKACNVQ